MGYFDDIDFEDNSHEKKRDKEELIEALLNKGESYIADLDLESIDELINYLLEKNQHIKALNCIDSLLQYFPYSNEIWQRKAIIYDNKGDFQNAIICFDKAISLNPTDEEAILNKGITLDNSGDFDEALYCFNRVLEIDPCSIDALFNKGLILEKTDNFADAISCFEKIITLEPAP